MSTLAIYAFKEHQARREPHQARKEPQPYAYKNERLSNNHDLIDRFIKKISNIFRSILDLISCCRCCRSGSQPQNRNRYHEDLNSPSLRPLSPPSRSVGHFQYRLGYTPESENNDPPSPSLSRSIQSPEQNDEDLPSPSLQPLSPSISISYRSSDSDEEYLSFLPLSSHSSTQNNGNLSSPSSPVQPYSPSFVVERTY